MTKRILAMVLVLVLVISMLPTVVLAEGTEVTKSPKAGTHTDAGHAGDCGVTSGWQAWESDNSLPTAGNWYLTKDIHITTGVNTTGDLNLCLNGFVIYKTGTGRIYGTKSGAANTMTVCDCTAYEENGVYYAGALTGGKMTSQDGGAAIFVRRDGILKVYDGRFIGNTYQNDTDITGGGVIMLQGVSSGKIATAYIYGGEFAGNKSLKKDGVTSNNGGVIGSGGSAVLEISGGRFHDNLGANGGVIRMGDAGKLTIKGGKFYDNVGTSGGVVQFNTGSTVTITGGEFTGNSGKDGGVLYGASSTVTITGATFSGNTATSSGSVLHNNGNMNLTIGEGTVITGNTGTNTNAAEGYSSAVSMCGSAGKLTLTGKVIIANNTTGATGVASLNFNKAVSDTLYVNELAAGSWVEFSTCKTVPAAAGEVIALNGTQSSWNNAWVCHMGTDGKLQYIGYDNGTFAFSDAHAHTLCADTGCTDHTDRVAYEPWGDDAEEKGKLPTSGNWYLVDDVTVTGEVKILDPVTLNLCLNGKTVTGFAGTNGRAYSTDNNVAATINISDCTAQTVDGVYKAGKFTGFTNKSTNSGGAVFFIRPDGTLNLFDGIITGNTTCTGGTVYIKNSTFHMWNGEISDNIALNGTSKKNGAGVYLDNSAMTLHNGKISGNQAGQGGGVYMYASSLTVKDGKINNNEADWGGGVAFGNGGCTLDMQGGEITGNTAGSNGGGLQGAYSAAVIKFSGDAVIFDNTLKSGAANNARLGSSASITVGQLGAKAKVGITASADRAISNAISKDLSGQFPSDDPAYVTFLNEDGKLQLKTKPADPVTAHKHTLCNDTGCTDHADEISYQAWTDPNSLPTEGNWYLDTDVTVSAEVNLSTAITVNLCMNGHKVTGTKGSNVRAYSTTNNVASTIQISDCKGGSKFQGFENTSTGSGGGVIFVRPGSTLKVFDVTFENNVSYCIGGAICTTGTTWLYDCDFIGNQAYKVANGTTTYTNGGAIYVNVSGSVYGQLHAYNCSFEENKALRGGAIYAASNTTTYVENATFTGNVATDEGGVYRCTNGNTTFKNVTMTDNEGKNTSAVCVYAGTVSVENAQITGNHSTSGFGAFHMNRNNAGADPITVTLKGKVVIDGNTAGTNNAPQNLFMREHEAYVDATGLTTGSKIGVTMIEDRIAKGMMNITTGQNGVDNSGYFESDDDAWVVAMDQEVYLKTSFTHIHCICGKADCADTTHEKVSFNAWTDKTKLPASGNYCLMEDVTITKEASVTDKLNLCLHGHKVTGGTGKGLRFLSTPGTGGEVVSITDCTAKWEDGVYTAGGFYNNTNTHTGSGGGAVFIRAGGTLNFYEGIVSGNQSYTGGAAFYIKSATANFFGGLVEKNIAGDGETWYNGGGIYSDSANVTVYNTVFSENEANYGGAIHNAGTSVLDIRGGKLTGNIAQANGGAINSTVATATLKLSGEPVITGNKLASGKVCNLRLAGTGMIQVENLGEKASIGVTANVFRAISTKTLDYTAQVFSDDTKLEVIYQDGVLYMSASGNHKHCLCLGALEQGCDHSQELYVEWDNPADLPTSGNYYLSVDVEIPVQARVEGATLNLCLNGHTIKVAETGNRAYYMTNGGKLNITDCAGGGKFTDAKLAAILTNANGKDMELNLYAGSFTGNHAQASGGAIVIQGECTFNMYGGKISGNTATSVLKTDENGKVILDAEGNETYQSANAGGLYVANGVFNMYGGEISGNEATEVGYLKAGATAKTNVGGLGGGAAFYSGATANLYGGKISGNKAFNGGGVFLSGEGTVLNLIGTEISGNTAGNGAGVLSQTHAVTYMTGGKITKNLATSSGAGFYVSTGTTLYMSGGEICENTAANGKTDKNGGGLYVLSSTVELTGGKIWGNRAANGAGLYSSAVMSGDKPRAATIYIKDGALITDNHASANGGGIMMSGIAQMTAGEGSKIIMSGGEISKNTSKNAAGILTQTKSAMELSGGKITGNQARDGGGGIYISTGTKFTMTGGAVTGNNAKNGGGGIFLLRSTATIKGGSVSYNTAGNGGGIKNNGAKLDIHSLSIVGNKAVGTTSSAGKYTAGNAGGLWAGRAGYKKDGVQMYDAPVINIYNFYLADNTATGPAGGILIQSEGTVFNMYGGTVTGNATEDSTGGGLYLSNNVNATITGGTFTGNKAKNSSAIHITNNNAKLSGIKVYDNHALGAAAITVTGKTTTESELKNAELYNNVSDGHVGALVIQGYANMTVEDTKIYGNKAGGIGGGVYFSNPGYGNFRNVEIYDNESARQAGGVFVGPASIVNFEDVTIRDNVANTEGGAIYNRGLMNLKNCKILNNTAKDGPGGGIGSYKTSSIIMGDDVGVIAENTVISGNKTNMQGGGVFGHRACPIYLTDCVITENTSGLEGGAIYSDGRLGLQSVTATGNTSGGSGFAIYLTESQFDGHSYQTGHKRMGGDMIVKDNQGGDVYLSQGTALGITGESLGEKSHMGVTLFEGVLSQWVFGVYNYEGGNQIYVLTAGDRSITDPEPYELPQETEPQPEETTDATSGTESTEAPEGEDNTLLYAGIGGIAAVVVLAAAVLVIVKKKKSARAESK